jgi:hypothetical protein
MMGQFVPGGIEQLLKRHATFCQAFAESESSSSIAGRPFQSSAAGQRAIV